ncbi:unnamed protein product, partial [marine sediment metagenome]
VQGTIERQSVVYRDHMNHGKRRDGEVYASIASEINDTPRTVMVTLPDGTRMKKKIMDQVYDAETGELVTLNDIYNK